MARPRFYVGLKVNNQREVFKFDHIPTWEDKLTYNAVIGPFRTKRGAKFMAMFGSGNPHCQCVADAERIAKLLGKKFK